MKIVVTCEHAGKRIPSVYQERFHEVEAMLNSHRGFDAGCANLFRFLQPQADFAKATHFSRLLIDTNRSLHHANVFSEVSKAFSVSEKEKISKRYYTPYRRLVHEAIAQFIADGEVVQHFSLHSFTPSLAGKIRTNDMGILFDPKRKKEKEMAIKLKKHLQKTLPIYQVRFNYPYLGTADGFTTSLRKDFPVNYSGIELEVNQKWVKQKAFPLPLKLSLQAFLLKLRQEAEEVHR